MNYIRTKIALPPGPLSAELVQRLLDQIFERYRWFKPMRYGFPVPDEPLPQEPLDFAPAMALYEDLKVVSIGARTDRDFLMIFPVKPGDPPHAGSMTWVTSLKAAAKLGWRMAHMEQVGELMRVLNSPYAYTATREDIEQKTRRWVREDVGATLTSTVRDPSQGLAGLFWRNFYGPPFIRLFGERLGALPPECVTRLGDECVLVQPYELPPEAGTEAARAREQHLISLLGPECFYDHEHHRPPTRLPVLDSLPQP